MVSEKSHTTDPSIQNVSSEPLPDKKAHLDSKLDVDDAFLVVTEQPDAPVLDEASNKRILRKIDMVLMPVIETYVHF